MIQGRGRSVTRAIASPPYAGESFVLRVEVRWRQEAPLLHIPSTSQYMKTIQSPLLLCQTLKTTITKVKQKHERTLCSATTSLLASHSLKATTTSDYFQRGEGRIFPRHPASHRARKMLFLHTHKPKTLLTHCELHRAMTWCNTLTWPYL